MEAILRLNDETPNSLLHSGEIIYAPRASALRCPQSEQTCISFLLGMGESAMSSFNALQFRIQDWSDDGGTIATACGQVLDLERADFSESEPRIFDVEGRPVVLSRGGSDAEDVQLLRIDASFGLSPRRCINHMRAKHGIVSARQVRTGALSRLFWISVALRITRQQRSH